MNFIPAVKAALPNGPPVIAAGGVATGAQVAGLLAMGADGVVLGTRFLFTPESCYTDEMKQVLVNSTWESTERSNAYDQAFETDFWPTKIDGRAICTNEIMADFKAGLPLDERIKRFKEATAAGKDTHLIMWAGVGVAQTNKIMPAAVSVCRACLQGKVLTVFRMSSMKYTVKQCSTSGRPLFSSEDPLLLIGLLLSYLRSLTCMKLLRFSFVWKSSRCIVIISIIGWMKLPGIAMGGAYVCLLLGMFFRQEI